MTVEEAQVGAGRTSSVSMASEKSKSLALAGTRSAREVGTLVSTNLGRTRLGAGRGQPGEQFPVPCTIVLKSGASTNQSDLARLVGDR